MEIRLAESDADVQACVRVLRELRPALQEDAMATQIREQQREGFRLAMLCDEEAVRCVAGFRVMLMLHSGRTMYVDDLVTASAGRSRGYGRAMLEWLRTLAQAEDCATFSLDSGTQRQEAHAFYLRERLRITSFHFAMPLSDQKKG